MIYLIARPAGKENRINTNWNNSRALGGRKPVYREDSLEYAPRDDDTGLRKSLFPSSDEEEGSSDSSEFPEAINENARIRTYDPEPEVCYFFPVLAILTLVIAVRFV
jgi:hypothetical protein